MNQWLDRKGNVQQDAWMRHQLLATENYYIVRQYQHKDWVGKKLALVWCGAFIYTDDPNYKIVWIYADKSIPPKEEPSVLSNETTEVSAIAIFEDFLVRGRWAEYFRQEDKGDEPVLFLMDNIIESVPHQEVGDAQMEELTDARFGAW